MTADLSPETLSADPDDEAGWNDLLHGLRDWPSHSGGTWGDTRKGGQRLMDAAADAIAALRTQLAASEARVVELEEALKSPHWYYDPANPDMTYGDAGDALDDYLSGEVAQIEHCAVVKTTFMARVTVHEDEDDVWVEADTRQEAERQVAALKAQPDAR